MNDVIRRGREGVLPLVGCWFNFQIVNSLLINLHILLRYPTPKFYFLMGPHAMPVRIKTWGQDDIMFKSTKIFHLFDKISGNSGRHFLQPSQPIDFQSILIYGSNIKLRNYTIYSALSYYSLHKSLTPYPISPISEGYYTQQLIKDENLVT